MENIKVKFTNMSERDEIQSLFDNLGYNLVNNIACEKWFVGASLCSSGINFDYWADVKEITLQYLRDLVVLKRNDANDATHYYGGSKYYLTDSGYYQYSENKWVNIDEHIEGLYLKLIEKEVKMKEKEYIAKVSGDMENYKIKVNNCDESKEVQELLFELGYDYHFGGKTICNTNLRLVTANEDGLMANIELDEFEYKEITINQLRDIVVLKRNDINDANYESGNGKRKYYLTNTESFEFINGAWVNIDEYVDSVCFKSINKEGEVKMKEYLDTNYELRIIKQTSGDNCIPSGWIEVPEGAEEYRGNYKFYKNNGELFCCSLGEWTKSGMLGYITLWQRKPETPNTSIQNKLKFIEKWLNGEKIQYILGVESEKTQWHNFTEGAMQYIKRSDIKFREAPKYVTINGIKFKSVEKLLKYVKNNFDLDGGE